MTKNLAWFQYKMAQGIAFQRQPLTYTIGSLLAFAFHCLLGSRLLIFSIVTPSDTVVYYR